MVVSGLLWVEFGLWRFFRDDLVFVLDGPNPNIWLKKMNWKRDVLLQSELVMFCHREGGRGIGNDLGVFLS